MHCRNVGSKAQRKCFLASTEFLTNPAAVLSLTFDSVQSVKTTMLPFFEACHVEGLQQLSISLSWFQQFHMVEVVAIQRLLEAERSGCQDTVLADHHVVKSLNGI